MKKNLVTSTIIFGLTLLGIFAQPMSNKLALESDKSTFLSSESDYGCLIYSSKNLDGHQIFAECNPGNTTTCICDQTDAGLVISTDYASVIANPNKRETFVNAISAKKFNGQFSKDYPVKVNKYTYKVDIRLTSIPAPDVTQQANPQAVHIMIQYYDGDNSVWGQGKVSREATIYWNINPWTSDYGSIKIYQYPLTLINTGIILSPDLEWHTFILKADFDALTYKSITIDSQVRDLSSYNLAKVDHNDWGNDVTFNITAESECASNNCDKIFYWETNFRNIELYCFRPSITDVTNGSTPSAGSVNLQAKADTGTINWYESLTGGSPVYTGGDFVTPILYVTTDYYVDATLNGCTSTPRKIVVATGINEIPFKSDIQAYPNPTHGQFEISYKDQPYKIEELELFSYSMKLLKKVIIEYPQNRSKLDLSAYPAGQYLVRIKSTNGYSAIKVIKE